MLRAGAGLIYSHVPLLAQDFADNQTRVIDFVSGPNAGRTLTLQMSIFSVDLWPTPSNPEDLATVPGRSPGTSSSETAIRKNVTFRLGYYETHTDDLFLVNPILPATGTARWVCWHLENTGSAHYRQAQATARYSPSEKRRSQRLLFLESRARRPQYALGHFYPVSDSGDPAQRVWRSAFRHSEPLAGLGLCPLPFWSLVFSPVFDMHSGFAYSNIDVFQDYVGVPNSLRFPTYFSLDVKVYRDFPIHIPFKERPKGKVRKIRIGVYSLDVTNRQNPHDVFSNVSLSHVWPV